MTGFVVWLSLLVAVGSESSVLPTRDPAEAGPQNARMDVRSYQQIRYVAAGSGSDRTGDGSARRPWATIGRALARITDASPGRRYAVLVAAGSYREPTIVMKAHVDLFGGFEPRRWQRDIFAHPTILDGEQKRRVVIGANQARLDGFVIANGRVRAPGAAILCTITGNATVEPSDFIHDIMHQVGNDGGAIACLDGATPTIHNNLIANNTTGVGGGGGIGARNYSAPIIVNNVLIGNVTGLTDRKRSRSSNGGAISCSMSSGKIINNLIINNRVFGNSDAGGIYCEYDASPEIVANYLIGNVGEDDGGAIYVMKSSEPLIADNIIMGNNDGGAIRLSKEGRAKIFRNVICDNLAGGVECTNSWMNLADNLIVNNAGRGVGYSNSALPHIRPSVLTGNVIRNNTTLQIGVEAPEPPLVSGCNVQGGFVGKGNTDNDCRFAADGIKGTVIRTQYDRRRYVTRLTVANGMFASGAMTGRVIRVGTQWSVVLSNASNDIIVWGSLSAGPYEILSTYQLVDGK